MKTTRCAIYTRKSNEEGLDMAFNSLDAQREAGIDYIKSQKHEGWQLVEEEYNDGGFSGGTMKRPGLQQLLNDIDRGRIDVVESTGRDPRYVKQSLVLTQGEFLSD